MVSRDSASHKAMFLRGFQSPHPTKPLMPDWIRPAHSLNNLMHFRYYGSDIARFLKPDNVTGSPLNPQNWNLYSYVRGNPVNMNDPTGHAGTRLTQALLPPPSGSAWDMVTSSQEDTAQTDEEKQAEQEQQENKPPEGANESDRSKAVQMLTAMAFSEIRGKSDAIVAEAVISVVLNRANSNLNFGAGSNAKGGSLEERVIKIIEAPNQFQGVGNKNYNAALKGEEAVKTLVADKNGNPNFKDMESYYNSAIAADKALKGGLKDPTAGATFFATSSTVPKGADPATQRKIITCDVTIYLYDAKKK